MSKSQARQSWTLTPVQGVIGRRVGIRYHWIQFVGGLAVVYVIGVVKGVKIGRGRNPGRSRGAD